jgi:hypothetical protein
MPYASKNQKTNLANDPKNLPAKKRAQKMPMDGYSPAFSRLFGSARISKQSLPHPSRPTIQPKHPI